MHILFIVPYTPTPVRTRPYNFLRQLHAQGHHVTLATTWSSPEEEAALHTWRHLGVRIMAVPLPRSRILPNTLRALITGEPLQASYSWHPGLASQILSEISSTPHPYDIAHVEHLRGSQYALHLGRRTTIPVVWDAVDCISLLFEQAAQHSRSFFGRRVTRLELSRTRPYEGWLISQFDRTLVTSPADKAALESLAAQFSRNKKSVTQQRVPVPPKRGPFTPAVTILPNGVDLAYFTPGAGPRDPATILFTGKLSYHANVTAALHLVQDIMPLVWSERPDARVVLAGQNPPGSILRLPGSYAGKVEVYSNVPDIRPYQWQATLAVAPLVYGVGISNKILEAMACGTPTIAAQHTLSALAARDGLDLLTATDATTWAAKIITLLQRPDLCQKLSAHGRAYVEKRHNWGYITRLLVEIYQETMSASPTPLSTL